MCEIKLCYVALSPSAEDCLVLLQNCGACVITHPVVGYDESGRLSTAIAYERCQHPIPIVVGAVGHCP
eukprot:scaffold50088_cov32-Tisochrysis_lutea.AAC.3